MAIKLRSLSDKDAQYHDAGLEEAYHLIYYIPRGTDDHTDWSAKILKFKKNDDKKISELFVNLSVNAIKEARLKFDYVIRVLGSNEIRALKSARLRPLAFEIAEATNAVYLPQLLIKKRATQPLHLFHDLASRINEIRGVFEITDKYINKNLNHKTILIVDDISTACVTVAEIVKTLKSQWPFVNCYLFCIARTTYNSAANVNI